MPTSRGKFTVKCPTYEWRKNCPYIAM